MNVTNTPYEHDSHAWSMIRTRCPDIIRFAMAPGYWRRGSNTDLLDTNSAINGKPAKGHIKKAIKGILNDFLLISRSLSFFSNHFGHMYLISPRTHVLHKNPSEINDAVPGHSKQLTCIGIQRDNKHIYLCSQVEIVVKCPDGGFSTTQGRSCNRCIHHWCISYSFFLCPVIIGKTIRCRLDTKTRTVAT